MKIELTPEQLAKLIDIELDKLFKCGYYDDTGMLEGYCVIRKVGVPLFIFEDSEGNTITKTLRDYDLMDLITNKKEGYGFTKL